MKRSTKLAAVGVAGVALLLTTASSCSPGSKSATQADQSVAANQLKQFQVSQPVPQAPFSQYRQTLIDVENAELNGVATTTFFYNQGSATPFKSCPSIGFPVPSTAQLTNPDQIEHHGDTGGGNTVIPQLESNGVYTGDSSGTYVVCVLPDGTKQVDYWEGFVEVDGGASHLDANGHIVGDSSSVTTGKK